MNIAMFAFAFISLLLSRIAIAQYPYPIAFTGPAAANVPNSLSYQDISIIRRLSDNKYFRFSKSNDTGLGLSVATSPTFGGPWTYSYAALSGHLKDPAAANRSSIHLWAPEVHYANDIYYLYYCINAPDHGNGIFDIAVATSPNLREGSWTDHGSVGIPVAPDSAKPDREYVRLGANILANGTYPSGFDTDFKHITFGSFNQGLYGVPLAKDLLTAVPDVAAVEILSDQYNPESDRDEKIAGNKTEGSYALHHGQYIYQFYSIGSCCASSHDAGSQSVYRVEVCRGLYSDGPTGAFLDRNGVNCVSGSANRTGTVVLASHSGPQFQVFAPGSIGILRDDAEGLVMYYQYKNLTAADTSLGFGYNYLGFDDGGWPLLSAKKSTA